MSEYTATKDSGIEWIGAIPATWKTHTLYQLVTQVKNKNSDLQETNLLSLSYGKIKRRDINSNGGLLPESFNGYNIIEDGDSLCLAPLRGAGEQSTALPRCDMLPLTFFEG